MEMESGTEHRRWTRQEFERLIASGILGEDERLELIEGEILVMSPQGSRHSALAPSAAEAFRRSFGADIHVREHSPVGLDDMSRPEPDLAVVRGAPKDYLDRLPGPGDIVLLLEIAESSHHYDLGKKARLYAAAGIAEYWVADVDERCVLVHRKPDAGRYRVESRHVPGETVAPARSGAGPITIADLLP